jgi:chitinase
MTRMRRLAIALITAGAVAVAPAAAGSAEVGAGHHQASATSSPHRWVIGYYPVYLRAMLPVKQIDWPALTHLVVGAVLPRTDGSLDTSFDDTPSQGPVIATRLAKAARKHHVVPILMVGGAGAHDGFAAAAADHRARLVKNLLSFMRAHQFAGLDLDWEPVADGDSPALRALVKALRAKAPRAVLTMPVGFVTKTFPHVPTFYGALARKLDRINVMTYGMAGAWDGWKTWHSSALKGAGPATPSDVALNVDSYEKAGVPAAKLGVGIGFYGSCWAGGVNGPRQPVGSSSIVADDNVMTYPHIMSAYFTKSAYHYDKAAQAPYLGFSQPTGPQHCTFVSYENPRSITAKGHYAERRGLGAEIIWAINEGHDKTAPAGKRDALLDAVHLAFH